MNAKEIQDYYDIHMSKFSGHFDIMRYNEWPKLRRFFQRKMTKALNGCKNQANHAKKLMENLESHKWKIKSINRKKVSNNNADGDDDLSWGSDFDDCDDSDDDDDFFASDMNGHIDDDDNDDDDLSRCGSYNFANENSKTRQLKLTDIMATYENTYESVYETPSTSSSGACSTASSASSSSSTSNYDTLASDNNSHYNDAKSDSNVNKMCGNDIANNALYSCSSSNSNNSNSTVSNNNSNSKTCKDDDDDGELTGKELNQDESNVKKKENSQPSMNIVRVKPAIPPKPKLLMKDADKEKPKQNSTVLSCTPSTSLPTSPAPSTPTSEKSSIYSELTQVNTSSYSYTYTCSSHISSSSSTYSASSSSSTYYPASTCSSTATITTSSASIVDASITSDHSEQSSNKSSCNDNNNHAEHNRNNDDNNECNNHVNGDRTNDRNSCTQLASNMKTAARRARSRKIVRPPVEPPPPPLPKTMPPPLTPNNKYPPDLFAESVDEDNYELPICMTNPETLSRCGSVLSTTQTISDTDSELLFPVSPPPGFEDTCYELVDTEKHFQGSTPNVTLADERSYSARQKFLQSTVSLMNIAEIGRPKLPTVKQASSTITLRFPERLRRLPLLRSESTKLVNHPETLKETTTNTPTTTAKTTAATIAAAAAAVATQFQQSSSTTTLTVSAAAVAAVNPAQRPLPPVPVYVKFCNQYASKMIAAEQEERLKKQNNKEKKLINGNYNNNEDEDDNDGEDDKNRSSSSFTITSELIGQAWFHDIEREEATQLLEQMKVEGCYLVRSSKRAGACNPYSLTIYHDNKIFHLNIRRRADNTFALGKKKDKEKAFVTVVDLIRYHQNEPIFLSTKGQPAGTAKLLQTPLRT